MMLIGNELQSYKNYIEYEDANFLSFLVKCYFYERKKAEKNWKKKIDFEICFCPQLAHGPGRLDIGLG